MGIVNKINHIIFVLPRILKYSWLSSCKNIIGKPTKIHPLLIQGQGKVTFGSRVQIGVVSSPNYYSGYSYIEARNTSANIHFGDNIAINNNLSIIADKTKITIEDNVIIGSNCSITDSDFHNLDINSRSLDSDKCKEVVIRKNCFIGNNVTFLKGSIVGENSIVAAGSVVTSQFPKNVVIGGIPAKIIKELNV